MRTKITCVAVGLGLAVGIPATSAISVQPSTYSFVPGSNKGSFDYSDETGNQLTDGIYGPSRLLTNADAIPYVGWYAPVVTIDFNFGALVTIEGVTVSALQAWLGNIALPDVYVYSSADGATWTPVTQMITPENPDNNFQNVDLSLSGFSVTTEYIQVQLRRNNIGPWIFVDEISFEGEIFAQVPERTLVANVPDAGATLTLLGMGLASLACFRRTRSSAV